MRWLSAVAIIGALVAAFFVGKCSVPKPTESIVIKYDTIQSEPILDTVYLDKEVVRYVARVEYDTINEKVVERVIDSVFVQIPISQYTFRDSLYKATLKGYEVHDFQMELYQKTITQTISVKTRPKWSFGVQVGYGIGFMQDNSLKTMPYVGVGIQRNILTW